MLFPGPVQNAQCNITSSPRNINATRLNSNLGISWVQTGYEIGFPESMHPQRHRVVHDIVLARNTREHALDEIFLLNNRDLLVAKVGS